jgi:L-threonylcarbamoyladenylate synthase
MRRSRRYRPAFHDFDARGQSRRQLRAGKPTIVFEHPSQDAKKGSLPAPDPPRWETQILRAFDASGCRPDAQALGRAATWLRQGVPVVIPTETVYGLAAPALDRQAVEAIFRIKGRPLDNPLIVHVAAEHQLASIGAELSPLGRLLARAFWPGPLTLVVNTQAALPWVTAGLDSIAVRHPRHPFAAALILEVGPLAAPSANVSGRPSPTRAEHAAQDLAGRVPLVVDGGDLEYGLESTVVDARGELPVLLRPGAITAEALQACCGRQAIAPAPGERVLSPGMKYRHYSPRAEVWLYPVPDSEQRRQRLVEDARQLRASGRRVAAIARQALDVDHYIALPADASDLGRQLFSWFRELDQLAVDCILIEGVNPEGIGRAVMDRLERAAQRVLATPAELALTGNARP